MKRLSIFILFFTMLQLPEVCSAFSAVAVVEGYAQDTINAAWNFSTQKQADIAALGGCRVQARDNGISQMAKKCHISLRQKVPGGGAIACGEKGCSSVSGYDTKQAAVDEAYRSCQKAFGNCQDKDITWWWDEEGYSKRPVKMSAAAKTCGPTPGRPVHSTYQCNNGDCIRTFDNGCSVRFQAPYCHDPFTGKWEWKPDGC